MERIVHLIFSLEVGGSENLVVDIANEQVKHADVSVILINKKYNPDLIGRLKINVHFYALNREEGNKRSIMFLFRLWSLLLRIRPVVIHCHHHNIIRLLPLFKRRTVLTVHCLNVSADHLKKYKQVYSISEAVSGDIKQRTGIISPVVENGINFTQVVPKSDYLFIRNRTIRLVQVGRLIHDIKGQDILLQALHQVITIEKYTNISVDFIGSGNSQAYLQTIVNKLGLQKHVFFLGERNRSWIYNNLFSYHILVQPSRSEGFGLTILEGIAAGLPVIASDHAGPHEILQHMPGGYLFKSGDVNDLAYTIKKVIAAMQENNIQPRCEISRQIADEKYSIHQTAKAYLRHYSTDIKETVNL